MLPEIDYSKISIRTPAWGVTACSKPQIAASNFNSHPRVGGDAGRHELTGAAVISIRTPAWGVTLAYWFEGCVNLFQFAPPRGGDGNCANAHAIHQISIRTPAWGVTGWRGTRGATAYISIRTPAAA